MKEYKIKLIWPFMSSVHGFMRAEPLCYSLFFKGPKAVGVRTPFLVHYFGEPWPLGLSKGQWDAPGDRGVRMPRLGAITFPYPALSSIFKGSAFHSGGPRCGS